MFKNSPSICYIFFSIDDVIVTSVNTYTGTQLPPPAKVAQQPPSFRPMSVVAMVAHLSYCWALVILSDDKKAWLVFHENFQGW